MCGSDAGLVTAISTACCNLLSPFKWEGAFVPFLPDNAKEVMQAPVPFIVGTISTPEPYEMSEKAALLIIERITVDDSRKSIYRAALHAPADYSDMQLHQELGWRLSRLNLTNLKLLLDNESCNCLDLRLFMHGMTAIIRYKVNMIRKMMSKYIQSTLCGDISYGDGWRRYGLYNKETDEFSFYADWFMHPRKALVEHQNAVVRTQMFSSFVEKIRLEYVNREPIRYACIVSFVCE